MQSEFPRRTQLSSGIRILRIAVARRRRESFRQTRQSMEHLNRAFLRQLIDALLILLVFQRIFNRYFGENLRRERRQLIKHNLSCLG